MSKSISWKRLDNLSACARTNSSDDTKEEEEEGGEEEEEISAELILAERGLHLIFCCRVAGCNVAHLVEGLK